MPGAFLLPPALTQAPLHSKGGAPHPTSSSDSSWAPSLQLNLTLSPWRWHQTPQAHKTVPPAFLTPPDRSKVPTTPASGQTHLPELLPEPREMFYSLDLGFITKGLTQEQTDRETYRARSGGGEQGPPCPLRAWGTALPTSARVHQPEDAGTEPSPGIHGGLTAWPD